MKIIRSIKQMSDFSRKAKLRGRSLGFVPTMGALHQGHLSLIKKSAAENDVTAVSIFVNPLQFSAREDFKRYPRRLKGDVVLCAAAGADIIFYPEAGKMYPKGYRTYVCVEGLSDVLCGKFRPAHFKGVATIVAKLFNVVNPDIAYFGRKDAQQAVIIKKMVRNLNMPFKIRVMPTLRDKDGLALSSRNIYLNPRERKDAAILYAALAKAKELIERGSRSSCDVIKKMRQLINKKKNVRIQYISIVDPENLIPVNRIKGKVLIALAVYIGKIRLIDNIIINV